MSYYEDEPPSTLEDAVRATGRKPEDILNSEVAFIERWRSYNLPRPDFGDQSNHYFQRAIHCNDSMCNANAVRLRIGRSNAGFVCNACNFALQWHHAYPNRIPNGSDEVYGASITWGCIEAMKRNIESMLSTSWHSREDTKLRFGTYDAVPWIGLDWWDRSPCALIHFAHSSVEDSSKVSYTMNNQKGLAGIQTRIKPGKYLRKYFGVGREQYNEDTKQFERAKTPLPALLSEDEIAKHASFYATKCESIEMVIATTADEIRAVYEEGPSSCMKGKTQWVDGIERAVVEAYASGDIGVAWIAKPNGSIRARGVVNLNTKRWTCLYGDPARLEAALSANGYTQDEDALIGCKMLVLRIDSGGYMAPYLDGPSSIGLSRNGEHFIIGEGEMRASNTSGVVDGTICPNCDEACDEDEMRFINDKDESWCESCAQDSQWCGNCEESFSDNEEMTDIDGEYFCESCKADNCTDCERCDITIRDEHACNVGGESWCESCTEEDSLHCDECGDNKKADKFKKVRRTFGSGQWCEEDWCDDCAAEAIECDDCECLVRSSDSSAFNGEDYCDDCAESSMSMRDRLERDELKASERYEAVRSHRRLCHFRSAYPLVVRPTL